MQVYPQEKYRRGFTLLEMLLVLGLIVVLLGLSVPGMGRMYARNQLKSTAQEFQGVLYQTRLQAMKTGKAIVFRYRYDSSVYEILPKDVFDQRQKSIEGVGAVSAGPELLEAKPAAENIQASGLYERMLPHQIVFGKELSAPETPPAAPSEFSTDFDDQFTSLTAEQNTENIFNSDWSKPVLFFPNGRTSQSVFELHTAGRYPYQLRLILRGLTGTAAIEN
ncbi:MAG: prepilin-type N-terminal cleavage/methylation domain-containing protein [Planctomycetaceae bacterium]|jgi:prepilin-type N-terminal cleavage/methylation domain-containing protein|nr:prepilin-type N-terminal cleavage/methylation domain-containing protein [Planctomycetaceae bacterium]